MPIQVQWDTLTQDQLVVELSAPLTWKDFQQGIDQAHRMIAQVDTTVTMIIWAKAALPPGFALPHFRTAFQNQPRNTGRVIIVPEEKPRMLMFFKRMGTVIQQAFPNKNGVVFVDTIDEARGLNPAPKSTSV